MKLYNHSFNWYKFLKEKSYFEQIDDIREAFEYGPIYEILVLNSSMNPLFKANETRIKLVSVN